MTQQINKHYDSILREKIKESIREKKISYLELSKKSGISTTMISRFMTGKSSFTIKTLVKIADVLELNLLQL